MPARSTRTRRAAAPIRKTARDVFGYDSLLPGQEEIVRSVLTGHDTLGVLPSGGGKSAVYQIATLLSGGPTVVVSPLLALQRDQATQLEHNGVANTAEISSMVGTRARREAFEGLREGGIEFVFLAPEQLARRHTVRQLRAAGPSLFVVDEAHCVSSWGTDFRPDYLRLGAVIAALGHPTVLALTATAAPPVRDEILERLRMKDPSVVVRDFDRPNIDLAVERFLDEDDKREALLGLVAAQPAPGIVYTATRARSEELAAELDAGGTRAGCYHGGMRKADRLRAQDAFMDGDVPVMVATNAFGMGIDKADVRFVVHYEIPDSLDSYYQEIGRAGRDGKPARAVLLYRREDLGVRRFLAGGRTLGRTGMEHLVDALPQGRRGATLDELASSTRLSRRRALLGAAWLERAGAASLLPTGRVARRKGARDAAAAAAAAEKIRQTMERSRLEMMRQYADGRGCRRSFLLGYFAQPYDPPCGACDNCRAGLGARGADGPFAVESAVEHEEFGTGVVVRSDGDRVTVLFDEAGYRTLSVQLALDQGVLSPAGPR